MYHNSSNMQHTPYYILFEAFLWILAEKSRATTGNLSSLQDMEAPQRGGQLNNYVQYTVSSSLYYIIIIWLVWHIPSWVHYRVRVSDLDQIKLSKNNSFPNNDDWQFYQVIKTRNTSGHQKGLAGPFPTIQCYTAKYNLGQLVHVLAQTTTYLYRHLPVPRACNQLRIVHLGHTGIPLNYFSSF